jgi:hypothetical protein
MKSSTTILALCAVALVLAACGSPERRAARAQASAAQAQEELVRQRLDLVAQYETCLEEAGGDAVGIEACDSYLRRAEALQ